MTLVFGPFREQVRQHFNLSSGLRFRRGFSILDLLAMTALLVIVLMLLAASRDLPDF